jgi:hypothetical protein
LRQQSSIPHGRAQAPQKIGENSAGVETYDLWLWPTDTRGHAHLLAMTCALHRTELQNIDSLVRADMSAQESLALNFDLVAGNTRVEQIAPVNVQQRATRTAFYGHGNNGKLARQKEREHARAVLLCGPSFLPSSNGNSATRSVVGVL